jgi:tetratricopeptide (TPR) repeat protein
MYVIRGEGKGMGPPRVVPVALGAALLALAAVATIAGADRARREPDARARASAAIERSVEHGTRDAGVLATARELRRELGRSPLDARTRVAYAGLLLGLARNLDDTEAARFHAERAAGSAPVTVSVNHAAALVLARAAHGEEAVALVREMFGYDRRAAARLLAALEPLVAGASIERGIPHDPDARLAWSEHLGELGRADEARAQLRRIHADWPDHLDTLVILAVEAATLRDFAELERLLPEELALDGERAAPLVVLRARWLAHAGSEGRARAEIGRGLALAPESAWIATLAGDALGELGADDEARDLWTRALHELPRDNTGARRHVLASLAALEDRQGRPAAALRHWQAVLALAPDDPEARRGVERLMRSERP